METSTGVPLALWTAIHIIIRHFKWKVNPTCSKMPCLHLILCYGNLLSPLLSSFHVISFPGDGDTESDIRTA